MLIRVTLLSRGMNERDADMLIANVTEMVREAIQQDDYEAAEDIIQAELGLGPEHLTEFIY
jgi:hypothetical protein